MALAVTHVILTIVVLDLFRHYVFGKKKFPRYWLVIGGIAGLLPDIDLPLQWLVNLFTPEHLTLHGVFTHSIFYVILILIVGIYFHAEKNHKWAGIMYVIAFGWFFHLLLDFLYCNSYAYFWPLVFKFNWCPELLNFSHYKTGIDALILVAWLVHEEVHKMIKDYI